MAATDAASLAAVIVVSKNAPANVPTKVTKEKSGRVHDAKGSDQSFHLIHHMLRNGTVCKRCNAR